MKSMTFDEFFGMPPGTIFGQATRLPHQFSTGLYRKGESFVASETDGMSDEDGDEVTVLYDDMLLDEDDDCRRGGFGIGPSCLDGDHRFLVYETQDIDRLVALLGRGPAAHGDVRADAGAGDGITWEGYNR